jgi:hypothetical protein
MAAMKQPFCLLEINNWFSKYENSGEKREQLKVIFYSSFLGGGG